MIKIYHNPRCRKSREGVAYLENAGISFEIFEYLKTPLSNEDLKEIIKKLNIKPIDLVRKQEAIWKSDYKGKSLNDDEIMNAMVTHPKLIERPIIVNQNKAIIGRPTENIDEIL